MTSFKCRKLKGYDREILKNHLLEHDWEELYATTNPNDGWKILIANIRETLDKLYPIKTHNKVRVKAQWITSDIFEAMLYRDILYTVARQTSNPEDWKKAKIERN